MNKTVRLRYVFLLFNAVLLLQYQMSFAQSETKKYEISLLGGWEHTLAQRGPHYKTEVSDVKFLKPVVKTLGVAFNVKNNKRFFYGLELFYDEFDFGYEAQSHNLYPYGLSIVSGKLRAADQIKLYKSGVRFGYRLFTKKRFIFNAILVPSIGYHPYAPLLHDTAGQNITDTSREIQYISNPAYQNERVKFFVKATVQAQYFFKKHFGISLQFSYQQGFSPFVIDTTNIRRPYEPTGPKAANYWTRINGSAFQGHVGLIYTFR